MANRLTMPQSLVQLVIILVLLQGIQGTIHHFDTKRHLESVDNRLDHHISRSDDVIIVDENFHKLLRARRQDAVDDPEAYPFNLTADERQYAQVIYSGEGSEVRFTQLI